MPEPTTLVWHVTPEEPGVTLLALLRRRQPELSWNQLRRLLGGRRLQVNGNLCLDEGRRLKVGDVVRLLPYPAAAPPTEEDVRIRHLDQHLVIVEKPAGMTTLRHAEERSWPKQRKQLQPTLDEILPGAIARWQRRARTGPPGGGRTPGGPKGARGGGRANLPATRRVRAVHRLDRETSGLMVFARTVDAERLLGLQFRDHALHRLYIAVALGHVEPQTIETRLVDDRGDGRRGSTTNPKLGKIATTHVRPVEYLPGYTVIECRLETGRTHQIRIHLAEAGHPLCGDKVYRGRFPGPGVADHSGAPRVALHAAELGFVHPLTDQEMHFNMPLPTDLVELIDRLRGPGGAKGPAGGRGAPPRRARPHKPVENSDNPPAAPRRDRGSAAAERPRQPRDPRDSRGPREAREPRRGRPKRPS